MNWIFKIVISALAVMFVAFILPGVNVDDYVAALWVAVVLSILNGVVKPILVILTIPATIVTLGLFLLVINASMILLADRFLDGFAVNGFWWALLFSLLLSVVTSILQAPGKKGHRAE